MQIKIHFMKRKYTEVRENRGKKGEKYGSGKIREFIILSTVCGRGGALVFSVKVIKGEEEEKVICFLHFKKYVHSPNGRKKLGQHPPKLIINRNPLKILRNLSRYGE